MLLQTMTPEEKLRQVSRIELDIRYAGQSWVQNNERLLKKRNHYPFSHIIRRDFKNMGTWNIRLMFETKPHFRHGIMFSSNAWQKYYVTKASKSENIGVGVYFVGGSHIVNGMPSPGTTLYEFTPHFLNRYRQRHLAVNGENNIAFHEMFSRLSDDIRVGISPDPKDFDLSEDIRKILDVPRVEGFENLVMFIRHGLCLGFCNRDYYCFLTYVSHDTFFNWQNDMFKVSTQLLDLDTKLKSIDPYYMIDEQGFRRRVIQRHLQNRLILD